MSRKSPVFYFAYGSNMSPVQIIKRCPDAIFSHTLKLVGYELVFAGWSSRWGGGVGTIRPRRGRSCWGVVYALTQADLNRLDQFEGCARHSNRSYSREAIELPESELDPVSYQTYMLPSVVPLAKPSKAYLDQIADAAQFWNFPTSYVRSLRAMDSVMPEDNEASRSRVVLNVTPSGVPTAYDERAVPLVGNDPES